MHDFKIANCDTDSIMFCRQDGSPFSPSERAALLAELNALFPPGIRFDDDGYFPGVLITKAKNYCLLGEDGKIKTKGSALKASLKERALKEFIDKLILVLLTGSEDPVALYQSYAREIMNLSDISRWTSKKTVTEAVMNGARSTEAKVLACLEDGAQMGDKLQVYFALNESLKRQDQWNHDHHVGRLLKKLHDTVTIFETVVDVKQFPNFSLKRNKAKLSELLHN